MFAVYFVWKMPCVQSHRLSSLLAGKPEVCMPGLWQVLVDEERSLALVSIFPPNPKISHVLCEFKNIFHGIGVYILILLILKFKDTVNGG